MAVDSLSSGRGYYQRVRAYLFRKAGGSSDVGSRQVVTVVLTDRYIHVVEEKLYFSPEVVRIVPVHGGLSWRIETPALELEITQGSLVEEWYRRVRGRQKRQGLRTASLIVSAVVGLILLGLLVWVGWWGLRQAARVVAQAIPHSVEQAVFQDLIPVLDAQGEWQPSQLPDSTRQHIERLFAQLRAHVDLPMSVGLYFRSMPGVPNAFAFPGGHIVITDELIRLSVDSPYYRDIAGVLAHELGHLYYRHSLQNLSMRILLTILVDHSVGGSEVLREMSERMLLLHYSRGMETEADEFARSLLDTVGISPCYLARLLRDLAQLSGGGGQVPVWLSTHPPEQARIDLLCPGDGDSETP